MNDRRILSETAVPHYSSFESPPDGFNIVRASNEELLRYGFPHRPDARRMPRAASAWHAIARNVRKIVPPKLRLLEGVSHGKTFGKPRTLFEIENAPEEGNWCGLAVVDQPNYIHVSASWTVPAVTVPPGYQNGRYVSSAWVGLGGFEDWDPTVVQAGTEHDTEKDTVGNPQYYAWIEWAPLGAAVIEGFPIKPGDFVTVYVGRYDQPNVYNMINAIALVVNHTTGELAGPFSMYPPQSAPFGQVVPGLPVSAPSGASAEWVVESHLETTSTASGQVTTHFLPMSDFSTISFIEPLTISDKDTKADIDPVTDSVASIVSSYNGLTKGETAVAYPSSAIVTRFLSPD